MICAAKRSRTHSLIAPSSSADLVQVEWELSMQMGVTAAGPYVKNLGRALRTLDR
jgi:hypothetical protein